MKLFLALPVYGAYNPHFVHSLLMLATQRPCELVIKPCVGDSLVARARNRLCADFLASDCSHLLFLDTDLIFSVEHIARLISHEWAKDLGIICGLYAKKQPELGWVCNLLDDPSCVPESNGLQKVKYAGTGCMMIPRGILDRIRESLPEIEYDPDDGDTPGLKWDFFGTGVRQFEGRRRYLSEDWMFCQRVLDLGFPIWMDTQVILKHVGEAVYPLQPIEAFAVDVSHGVYSAVRDVDGWLLFSKEGHLIEEWPSSWPETVGVEFLRARGVKIGI